MPDKSDRQEKYPPLPGEYLDRVDRAWKALEAGEIEAAGLDAEELMDETNEHPEVRLLFAAALLEAGAHAEALEQLEACQGSVDDQVAHQFYFAAALFENLRVEEAENLYRELLIEAPDSAPARYGLAQVLEFLGHWDEAEHEYEEAHRLEPSLYTLPIRMKPAAFERVVEEALQLLPQEIREKAGDLPILIEPMPTRETLLTEGEEEPITPSVLGLFVGPSLPERSSFDAIRQPNAVFIYQRNLERIYQTREELINEIKLTLYHELGHYLGLSEEELEERGLD